MLDVQIRDGVIIDGTGRPGFTGCLNIKNGRIVSIGTEKAEAEHVVEAGGSVVCPGFIDVHSHADFAAFHFDKIRNTIYQGVCTAVCGNCGFSVFPVSEETENEILLYSAGVLGKSDKVKCSRSFEEYGRNKPSYINVVSLVGQGTLSKNAVGNTESGCNDGRMEALCMELQQQLEAGAAGLSAGLIYPPGTDTPKEELIALARVVEAQGKIFAVHIRDEGKSVRESVREILSIAEETGVHVHFSHHKIMGREYWNSSQDTLRMIAEAQRGGLEVSLDAYPYEAGCSTALVLLPPWVLRGGTRKALSMLEEPGMRQRIRNDIQNGLPGWEDLAASCGWENLIITRAAGAPEELPGRSLSVIAEKKGRSEFDCLADLLVESRGDVSVVIRGMDPKEVRQIICNPDTLIGSDSLYCEGVTHPRKSGTFPKIIREYVCEKEIFSIEQAIHKMTGKAAETFGISGRGKLRSGYAADVAVFQTRMFLDKADYLHPDKPAEGLSHLFINGRWVIKNGSIQDLPAGRILHI